jgi:4-amino-4-deoxy-L-arabinose transferase-like glycosyltransferase
MDDRIPSRRALFLLLAIFAAAWFGTLEYRKLVKPDEGRYAEIPREMVASGDWVTPRLNDIKYFEKPALQYWATAAAYSAFGEHHWTARLWPALTGFLGILAVWLAGLKLYGPRAALYGAAALGGSILWVLIGHINTLDMGVSFFLSMAIFGFVLAQRDAASARETRNAMLLAWGALGLAVLSKGLIGLVLPGAALVLYTLWQRDWALWRRLHPGKGLVLLLAITAPWFVAVSLANPEFFHFFFIHEHFERFMTKAHGRYQPMWYFLPILAVGFLPWTLALIGGMAGPFRREGAARFRPDRFLLVWIAVVFGFFSVSSSKLVAYILPLFPAAALLAGRALAEARCRSLRWHAVALLPLALIWIGVAVTQVPKMASPEVPLALFDAYVPWLIAAGAALAATAVAAFVLFRREAKTAGVLVLSAGSLLFAQLALSGHNSLAPANSAWQIVETIRPEHRQDIPFYSVNTYDQTLQPYLRRTTTMVGYMDELGFGIAREPEKFIPDLAAFEKVWNNQPAALALMDAETYEKLAAHALPMRVIARDTRRIIVRKP